MNNKLLLFIFAGLLAIFGLTYFFSGKEQRSFKPEIIQVDSSKVTSVVLHVKADSLEEVILKKDEAGWTVSKGNRTLPATPEVVSQLLSSIALVKTSYIAAKTKDKWAEYELEEDEASRITVYAGKKVLADFYVGKFNFNQMEQKVTSFLRLVGGDEIYAVEGMVGLMLGQGFNSYRNKQVLELDIHAIESLKYEGATAYTVSKTGDGWMLNGNEPLDTTKVRDFLLNLRSIAGDELVEHFDPVKESGKLFKTLSIEGKTMQSVVVRCWQDTAWENPYVIQSSQFPDAFFASDTTRLFKRIFKPVSEW